MEDWIEGSIKEEKDGQVEGRIDKGWKAAWINKGGEG